MPELITELNVFCVVPQTMQIFTEVMKSGTKSTHRFVIIFGISSLFSKFTKRRSPAANVHDLSPFSYYLLTPAFMKEV